MNELVKSIITKCGGPACLGRLLGVTHQTVYQWSRREQIPENVERMMRKLEATTYPEIQDAIKKHKTAKINEFGDLEFLSIGYDVKADEMFKRLELEYAKIEGVAAKLTEFDVRIMETKSLVNICEGRVKEIRQVEAKVDQIAEHLDKITKEIGRRLNLIELGLDANRRSQREELDLIHQWMRATLGQLVGPHAAEEYDRQLGTIRE